MSDTHPSAFRTEATEKRTQAAQLNGEADALDAQADELEGITPTLTPETNNTELPEGGETFDTATEAAVEEAKPSRIPFKK